MLTAQKSLWFEKIFSVYNRNLFKRRFNALRVAGLDNLKNRNPQTPLIIYANHSSWWDGLTAFEISRCAKLNAFVMMEEKQLKKLFPFRLLGAFSVVRENSREAVKSINYAVDLLKTNKNAALWIFPQGKILPADLRPLVFYHGVSRIIERLEICDAVPLAFRYEFRGEYKPEILVKIGNSENVCARQNFQAKNFTSSLEKKLTQILDDLQMDISDSNLADYKALFE